MVLTPWALLQRAVPVVRWSRAYDAKAAVADLVAGVTVGLTLIPQSIAVASLAGLEPQYGLYASLCGGMVYMVFGTIAELNIAPTALISLLTFTYTHNNSFGNVSGAILLCFLSGVFELLCGVLHLGFLIDFVSTPVVAAFTSAGAIMIATAQVKNLFGMKFQSEDFADTWMNVFQHFGDLRKMDTILGFTCCAILLCMEKIKTYTDDKTSIIKKILWYISLARNAIVVLICALIAYFLDARNEHPFALTSQLPVGWPKISPPPFVEENKNGTVSFIGMVGELGAGVFVLPFVSTVANLGIAKTFAKGKVIDASQEMVALGMCNIASSFFQGYPINAAFSTAAVGSATGIRTPFAGVYITLMVIMAFMFLTPYFSFIPKATLAAVIICAVIFMVEVTMTKLIWKTSKLDLIPFIISFFCCLFVGLVPGILVGVLVDILKLLYTTARPKVLVEKVGLDHGNYYIKVTPTSAILFPSAEHVREKILSQHRDLGHDVETVLIDCHRMNKIDYTAGKCLGDLVSDLKKMGRSVSFLSPTSRVSKAIKVFCTIETPIYENEADFHNFLLARNPAVIENGHTVIELSSHVHHL